MVMAVLFCPAGLWAESFEGPPAPADGPAVSQPASSDSQPPATDDSQAEADEKSNENGDESSGDEDAGKKKLFATRDKPKGGKIGRDGSGTKELLHQMIALVFVILVLGVGCMVIFRKVLPRLKTAGGGKKVRVLERVYLANRQSVWLMEVGTRKLLVASGRDGVQLLKDVTEGFAGEEGKAAFSAVLEEEAVKGAKGAEA